MATTVMDTAAAIATAADLLKASHHGVAFTGAGISTPSGIPDFRSPKSGLWEESDAMQVGSLQGFRHDPQRFYDWVRPLLTVTLAAYPNPAHIALAELEKKGIMKAVITQNIDILHSRAGSKTVYEVHGNLREATCISCYRVYPTEELFKQFLLDSKAPCCSHCGGWLKPNVILFGEQLPYKEWQGAKDAIRQSDLVMIVGSSLVVAPVCDLPRMAKARGAKVIIINLQPTDQDALADVVIHADAAVVLPAIVTCLEKSP
jgi:NAD-dependent deacetylase